MTIPGLDPTEERAWRAYRRMFTLLEATLTRELTEASGLSMADYTVLSNLVEVEGRRWRLTELADYMQWSQSRLSHQIKRMEARGLVMRQQVADDARGAHVVLTRSGLHAIAAAAPTHVAGVRRHMIDHLTPRQLEILGDIGETVVERLTENGSPGSPHPSPGRAHGGHDGAGSA